MPYGGDFYQGDPGFFSGFGRMLKGVGSFIPGVGGIVSKVGSVFSKFGAKHPTLTAAGGAAASGIVTEVAATGVRRMMAPGAALMPMGQAGPGGGMMRMQAAAGAAGMTGRGFHMSKPRRGVPSHPVRNRRMRVTNPKALRRAIRRAKGFERLARKVMHFVSPRAHKGRAVFKTRRRK